MTAVATKQPMGQKGRRYIQMKALDMKRAEILQALFGLGPDADQKAINKADQQMWRWRQHPQYDDLFEDEIRKILREAGSEAVKVLVSQMQLTDQPWLQNKAANDVMNHRKQAIYGEDEKQITVKVEGMPELGIPDRDE